MPHKGPGGFADGPISFATILVRGESPVAAMICFAVDWPMP